MSRPPAAGGADGVSRAPDAGRAAGANRAPDAERAAGANRAPDAERAAGEGRAPDEGRAPGTRALLGHVGAAAALAWRGGPGHLGAQAALACASGLAPVLTAWFTKIVLDRLAEPGVTTPALLPYAVGLLVLGALAGTVPHLAGYAEAELERRVGLLARDRLYTAVNRLPGLVRLEDPAFQDRLHLAEQASRSGPGRLVTSVLGLAQGAIVIGGFLLALTSVSPVAAGLVLLTAAPLVRVHLQLSREQAAMLWSTGHGRRRELFFARLLSMPHAAKEVRLFGLGDFFRDRMLDELRAVNAEQRGVGLRQLRGQGALALMAAVIAGAGLIWIIGEAVAGRATVGDLSVFVAAVAGTQAALAGAVQRVASAHQALLLFGHYRAVLEAEPDLPRRPRPSATPALSRGVELRDVWFRYSQEQPWTLRGVDLTIPRGRSLALVGLNGAGKSTLVKLLCRFYDPDRGSIRWDGVDLRDLDPDALRERMGAVFQDFGAYDLSVAENIAVGDLSALGDRARLEAAAGRAGAAPMVRELPRGYDTLLTKVFFRGSAGEEDQTGVTLSGGQWQRVALARGLLRDRCDLMILDEPSSGLDPQAEHEVHTALREHREGRTTLLISHRLSAVRDADAIAVLAEGRIVELGGHDDLMRAGGRYAELFETQARGYAPAGTS
ncbi:ABC transporter ATP-binding protein [Streptosporangium carneum]|uniref:Multidrug ABC transporter permease n=1 Tax=Streptosporangium carneum TaxID=47481 RepID=A0A9W6MCG4_9ACTN|nr:ABC transporter ATP-binding protein [Streptosporangium carneum]GLK08830.1 multidrug ABC transporter permease [Streptosporangium carneum]